MFNLFKKKIPLRPLLDEALKFKMITEEEYLQINAQRADRALQEFLGKEKRNKKPPRSGKP